jgi:hypothetical protein
MTADGKRVREQAVVYLADRDRALLEELAQTTGLSRTELFRRGLWALAEQMRTPKSASAMELLIAGAADFNGPADYSERSDDYLYGGKPLHAQVAEESSTGPTAADTAPVPRKRGKRARPR